MEYGPRKSWAPTTDISRKNWVDPGSWGRVMEPALTLRGWV